MTIGKPPVAGSVLRYSYLWKREARAGAVEGRKDRPVALVVAVEAQDGECVVVPIAHAPPTDPDDAVEVPARELSRLGLDGERAWIVLTEFNSFIWPGHDLRPVPNVRPPAVVYGRISRHLYRQVLSRLTALLRGRRVQGVPRT